LAVAAMLVACQAGPAPVTPTDLSGIVQELNRGGVRVSRTVSGQTGCDDAGLAGNAVHLLVALDDAPPRDAYLFRFRSRQAWTAGADEVEACRRAYAGSSGNARGQVDELDISPFRMFGSGWDRGLRDAMEAALTKAAGDGGNPGDEPPIE
jgi:hypothetical protein